MVITHRDQKCKKLKAKKNKEWKKEKDVLRKFQN